MTEDERRPGEPKEEAFVWSPKDAAELWRSIVDDATIDPVNRRAAFRAALKGEPEWWYAAEGPEEEGEGPASRDSKVIALRDRKR